ncbi:MAG: PD-(D/E)XK nuclease-like domain-containing protein [Shewanella algae]
MQFKLTFEPMAAARKARGLVSISYIVEADTRVKAELMAVENLESEGYARNDFKRAIKCFEVEPETAPEPEPDEAELPAAAVADKSDSNQEAANDTWDSWDDFDLAPIANAAPVWTIESLNARLEQLRPGEILIIDNLSDEIYHGSIGVSCSKIKLFLECPQKYHAKYNLGICRETEKAYFDFGKAAHCALLEPWRLNEFFIRQPDEIKVRNGNKWAECKAAAEAAGQTVLTANQWDDVQIILNAEKPKALRELITGGICERSIFKRDQETGLVIKVRPDYTIGRLITDLKTCADGEPSTFSRNAKKLGYHIQDAMYSDVAGAEMFVFLAIESSSPFVVTAPIVMDADAKRLGYLQYRKGLRGIKQCIDTGVWPPYTTDHVSVSLSQWEKQQLEYLEAELMNLEHKDDAA